jgi:hypothetical protein
VYHPAALDPGFLQADSNRDLVTFPFPAAVSVYVHPTAACQEKASGVSGIHRQQGRDLHVSSLKGCGGGPGDIAEIRLCKLGWANTTTPYGPAGPNACVGLKVVPTCHAT